MYNNYNPYQGIYNNMLGQQQQPLYNQPQQNNMMGAQKYQVTRVNGKNGADAFQMPPNSSIFLLDETAPIVWLKITDGAGYPTVTPYDITPHQTEQQIQQVDLTNIEQRLTKLEDIINGQQISQSSVESTQPVKRISASK